MMELHRPKFTVITCNEAQECELLARFLSRYGYRIKTIVEEQDRFSITNSLEEGLNGAYDAVICQSMLCPRRIWKTLK